MYSQMSRTTLACGTYRMEALREKPPGVLRHIGGLFRVLAVECRVEKGFEVNETYAQHSGDVAHCNGELVCLVTAIRRCSTHSKQPACFK